MPAERLYRARLGGIGRVWLLGAVFLTGDAHLTGRPSQAPVDVALRQGESALQRGKLIADFGAHIPSSDARQVADWIAASGDNRHSAFLMVDKKFATLYVFDGHARLRGQSPVLLGAAVGDDSVPGIGLRALAQVRPEERITPAGRFIAERGHNARGEDVVWVDYATAVSMHRVLRTHPQEHRLERLASKSLADKRISWGCINVPVAFYETMVRPVFVSHRAPVYVLPEVKSLPQVFEAYGAGSAS